MYLRTYVGTHARAYARSYVRTYTVLNPSTVPVQYSRNTCREGDTTETLLMALRATLLERSQKSEFVNAARLYFVLTLKKPNLVQILTAL